MPPCGPIARWSIASPNRPRSRAARPAGGRPASSLRRRRGAHLFGEAWHAGGAAWGEPSLEAVEIEVDDGCCVEGEGLAEDEAADHGEAEWAAEFGSGAVSEHEGEA